MNGPSERCSERCYGDRFHLIERPLRVHVCRGSSGEKNFAQHGDLVFVRSVIAVRWRPVVVVPEGRLLGYTGPTSTLNVVCARLLFASCCGTFLRGEYASSECIDARRGCREVWEREPSAHTGSRVAQAARATGRREVVRPWARLMTPAISLWERLQVGGWKDQWRPMEC